MRIRRIDSTRNSVVREAIAVAQKRSRYKHRAFIIEGHRSIEAALDAGASVQRVFLAGPPKRKEQALLRRLARAGTECLETTGHIIEKIAGTETPQGMLAIASVEPAQLDATELAGPVVVLDGIADPGNLGAIVRTADAAGCAAVVLLEGTCDVFSPKALRATAGSIFNLPLLYEKREAVAEKLRSRGYRVAVAESHGGESIYASDLSGPLAVVFGNEARGASRPMREAADLSVHVPLAGRAESLNVAQAAAVVLFEARRQQGGPSGRSD